MKCPVCNQGELVFEKGYPATREEPGEPDVLYCSECDASTKQIEKHIAFSIHDLAERIGCDVDGIAKVIYKATECGCVFSHDENGVSVGGYAEGFDGELPSHILDYPFLMSEFWGALDIADKEGSAVWECVNTHDEDCECYLGVYS